MSHGIVWKYGDNVNTDVIFPGRYTYQIMPPEEMAKHAMEDLDPGFAAGVKPGDVILAGKNFGCGSAPEEAGRRPAGGEAAPSPGAEPQPKFLPATMTSPGLIPAAKPGSRSSMACLAISSGGMI